MPLNHASSSDVIDLSSDSQSEAMEPGEASSQDCETAMDEEDPEEEPGADACNEDDDVLVVKD